MKPITKWKQGDNTNLDISVGYNNTSSIDLYSTNIVNNSSIINNNRLEILGNASNPFDWKLIAIWGGAAVLFIVIVVSIVLWIVWWIRKRRKAKKNKTSNSDISNTLMDQSTLTQDEESLRKKGQSKIAHMSTTVSRDAFLNQGFNQPSVKQTTIIWNFNIMFIS